MVEVYPAAALRQWRLPHRGYKGSVNTAARHQLVDELLTAAPWLRLGDAERTCRHADHALDAVIAALNARAAALGQTTTPTAADHGAAQTEGWIASPTTTVLAGYESVRRLLDPQPLTHVGVVIAAGIIGFAGNELVAIYRIRVGRRIGSAALVADGFHARTDGFTSLAVVAGALGVLAGFPLADPLVGILITVAILAVLRGAVTEIGRRLMDAVDPALVDTAESSLRSVDGIRDIESLRLRWIGHRMRAEADVLVDPTSLSSMAMASPWPP